MRILLACAAFPPHGKGGGPAASELIARMLADRGHIVRVVTIADFEHFEVRRNFQIRTIPSLNVHWNYWQRNSLWKKAVWHILENFNPLALKALRGEIRAFQPDILTTVSVENVNVATWLAGRLEGVPVAHVIQSYFLMCWRGGMFKRDRNCTRPCFDCVLASLGKKFLSRYVDGVLAETRFALMMHLQAGYFSHAVRRVVPGPVEPAPAGRRPFREGRAPLRIGYIGIFDPIKGIETLAAAATVLSIENINVEFLIAGDGPDAYTRLLISKFPSSTTRFLGWVDPSEFYGQVDVVVVPSLWREVFGRVSVEPLAFGVPVIVARSGGLPENIVDGDCGYCFSPGNAGELVSIIRELVLDVSLYRRLSHGALHRAQCYDFDRIGRDLDDFLSEVRQNYRSQRT